MLDRPLTEQELAEFDEDFELSDLSGDEKVDSEGTSGGIGPSSSVQNSEVRLISSLISVIHEVYLIQLIIRQVNYFSLRPRNLLNLMKRSFFRTEGDYCCTCSNRECEPSTHVLINNIIYE